ncbi:MAG: glycosyltransferase family 2 protein [Thermodesulfobacteriota bacterium]
MPKPKTEFLLIEKIGSSETLLKVLDLIKTDYALFILNPRIISFQSAALGKFIEKAEKNRSAIIYSDFCEMSKDGLTLHPLNDYQLGSVRDDFDFGSLLLVSTNAIIEVLKKYGLLLDTNWGSLYDLRLKVSIEHRIDHLREPLYTVSPDKESASDEKRFFYLDPKNRIIQIEMEKIFTDYLKRIGAYLPQNSLKEVEPSKEAFPVDASVVIPVRNRKETIAEAMESVLRQETNFPYNILVVDNHSTDGTTTILSRLAHKDHRVLHLIPKRTNLGIGGCWNEAIAHPACGRYVVQLDSDDLYSTPCTLQMMVDRCRQGRFGMVIGSYTLVDFNLKEISPGLIDHREWTDENGHNNILRINGFGAPRAFDTSLIRKMGFPNLNYGEDYALGLRICRKYKVGRIYESLYLCRRWSGNSDANLSLKENNQKDALKDRIRTKEILARKKMNPLRT